MEKTIHIIGGGLAGSEAAWQIANSGLTVVLHEMRPVKNTNAHKTEGLAELVCSNSFRSDDHEYNAVGLLHEEMRRCNSLIMSCGDKASVPAGGALAVDRDIFSDHVTKALEDHPNIKIVREEVTELPLDEWQHVIIATGPLTSDPLAKIIADLTGEEELSFFDAIAPIIYKESINFDKAWMQSRYDKGSGTDYINCGMTEEEYKTFIQALIDAEKTEFKEWEKDTPYFEGCLPVEVMAERGVETLRFGPLKPVGLTDPNNPTVKPYAIVQLRQDNKLGTLYNMVGFQTKMKWGAQKDVFRMIPGLENAEFARLGGIHRNTFINSPKLLDETLRLKNENRIRFAGQITGCEGYVESAAVGLMVGRFMASDLLGLDYSTPPETTALGSLLHHITGGADASTYQPMNINFGLFPPMDVKIPKKLEDGTKLKKVDRKRMGKKLMSDRALEALENWKEFPTLKKAA
ncbi:MAG: methylenetetrahydrofolate--tRNA-(uracil(54)-C(5))-methyltransferase (FADH(2)-oxidizing) TrmFO [Rickettsiales bacterium]|nr:methylenetetrahydrofolate--tRNA-(uracil(54)-C(5))-methyltransferase (FADH(2)-oxidizing) TrmFO [Rickettsiales bacterium]